MNSINFTGNCGRDGEIRYTPNGDAVLGFSVALSSGYGDKKVTTWLNCSIFGKRAESLEAYVKKGTQVAVSGEFLARPYKDASGNEKLSLDVRVSDLTLIGGASNTQNETKTASEKKSPKEQNNQPKEFSDFEDDIPF